MIIGLTGYAGAGKDTVAQILASRWGFRVESFAAPLKRVAYDSNPLVRIAVDLLGEERAKRRLPFIRRAYQALGASARSNIGEHVWAASLVERVSPLDHDFVVADVRYPNEEASIRSMGGFIWRITRPGVERFNDHPSETSVDLIQVDWTIENAGSLDDLRHRIAFAYYIGVGGDKTLQPESI